LISRIPHARSLTNHVLRRHCYENSEDLLWADAFILGTPENFGYMSGAMKVFLDRVYYDCEGKVDGRAFALFIRAGNDGTGAISSIRRILTGLEAGIY
jgi:multimeric flavodoxin WrbA